MDDVTDGRADGAKHQTGRKAACEDGRDSEAVPEGRHGSEAAQEARHGDGLDIDQNNRTSSGTG
jgi:hypothetical protein